jgi:hypothetical protein
VHYLIATGRKNKMMLEALKLNEYDGEYGLSLLFEDYVFIEGNKVYMNGELIETVETEDRAMEIVEAIIEDFGI